MRGEVEKGICNGGGRGGSGGGGRGGAVVVSRRYLAERERRPLPGWLVGAEGGWPK